MVRMIMVMVVNFMMFRSKNAPTSNDNHVKTALVIMR